MKNHISRDDYPVCGEIKAIMALVIRRVAKEDTSGGPRGELMWHCGSSVRVTHIAEDSHMLVRGYIPEKGEMRTCNLNRLRWKMFQ
jgi:hypothetical protein